MQLSEEVAPVDETAVFLQLLADGFAGGLKWMLTDTRDGTDPMGLFRMDGRPKPLAHASEGLARYLAAGASGPASLTLEEDRRGVVCYTFRAEGALFLGGSCPPPPEVRLLEGDPTQVFVTWTGSGRAQVLVTVTATLEVRLASLLGGRGKQWVLQRGELPGTILLTESGGMVQFRAVAGDVYRLTR